MLYKKVDASSPNSITAALDLFSTPPTNCAITNSMYRLYHPLNPISSLPFLFKVHPLTSMIDLSNIYVITEVRLREVAADGTLKNMDKNDIVAPIQMPGGTFIRNLKISLNQREVYDANQLYSYKVMMDTEFSFPTPVKDSYLTCAGYHREKENPNRVADEGYVARKNMFSESKTVQLIHKLSADILNQDLFMITNTEIDFEITPQNSEFMILQAKPTPPNAAKTFKFEIINIALQVKTIDLMDSLSLELNFKLDKEPAKYGVRKTMLKTAFISAGRKDYIANIFTDEVPRRIMIGFVSNENFVGDVNTSPFFFDNFNVREIELMANGRIFPQSSYNLDYKNKLYTRAYHDTQSNLGFASTNESNGITYKMFHSGWNVYCFNLTNAQEESPGFELVKDGCTIVTVRFSEAVPAGGIQMIAYAESDGLILVDRNRTITSDLTV